MPEIIQAFLDDMKLAGVNIGSVFQSPFGKSLGLADLVSIILSNVVALAAITMFLLMLAGGIMVIAGAGSGDKENVGRGKKAITSALMGFLIIFCAYWIIVIVEKIFGFKILEPF